MQIQVKAFHLKGNIDIKKFKQLNTTKSIHENSTELFYKNGDQQYYFVINYGAIVFFNQPQQEIEQVLKLLVEHFGITSSDLLSDEFEIIANPDAHVDIEFGHLTLREIDYDAVKIIMLNMAQSIALNYYDQVSQQLITEVRLITTQMETKGKLSINKKNILKFIGKALNTQNRIAENLYIFDSPPITWESEYYNRINKTLASHFELNARYRSIESNFKIVEANLHAFLDVNNHHESSRLEWIIIILILVEVIDTFAMKFL